MTKKLTIHIDTTSYDEEIDLIPKLEPETTHLTIHVASNQQGWIVGPPLSSGDHNLTSLYHYGFFMDALPDKVENLSELVYLDISSTGLKHLPDLSNFKKLERLDISFNPIQIENETDNLSRLTSLKILNIRGCDFTDEDLSILSERLKGITILHLFHQNTSDYFPEKPIIPDSISSVQLALLERIHHFYPVGLPHLNKLSSQYKNYKAILDQLTNRPEGDPWNDLVKKIQRSGKITFMYGCMLMEINLNSF